MVSCMSEMRSVALCTMRKVGMPAVGYAPIALHFILHCKHAIVTVWLYITTKWGDHVHLLRVKVLNQS